MRSGERPSMVATALPCTADTGMRQENMRSPSMCTMQAPHWPAPQPNLVPVSFSSSRSTHRRRVPSGAATLTCLLLTVNSIAMMAPLCWAADGPEGWIGYRRGAEPCYSAPEIGVNAAVPLEASPLILGYVLWPLYLRRAKRLCVQAVKITAV